MEHLLDKEYLEGLQDSIPKVLWLGFDHDMVQEYDVVSFEQYPVVRGWSTEELEIIRKGNALSRDATSTLAMLQSWLFFGLLESSCQEHFSSADFVATETKLLKTGFLRNYFRDKAAELRATTESKALPFLNTLRKSQEEVSRWVALLNLVYDQNTDIFTADDLAPIMRTTTLLGEMLYHFEEISATNCKTWLVYESPSWNYSHLNKSKLLERLQNQGWCPSTYDFLVRDNISVTEFTSITLPTDIRAGRHQDCSRTECYAHNIKIGSYQTLHLNTECRCEFIRAPLEDIRKYLSEGRIFALNLEVLLGDSSLDAAVVPFENSMDVVAFSHIWSDGMGSYAEAGLPYCHVSRLRDLVQGARPEESKNQPPLIWIDSLCIPIDKEARRSAIRTMATVYKKASTTIVLDSSLLRYRYNPSERPFQELAVKILASTWMRRLWTLQEGALATELLFILDAGNVAVSASWILHQAEKFPHCLITMTLARTMVRMVKELNNRSVTLSNLLPLLGYRSCTKPEDETLAISPILGLDESPLLMATGEERMAIFWRLIERLPLAVIFLDGPKFQTPGLRWALKSIISRGTASTIYGSADAVVTEEGLLGEYLVLRLDEPTKMDLDSVYHIRFRPDSPDHDLTILQSRIGNGRYDQTSLGAKKEFSMAIKMTSKVSSFFCTAMALTDRFYPESYVVLLREAQQMGRLPVYETYQYACLAFMMEIDRVEAAKNKINGRVKMREICIS
jgi:hypothetical protein